nr:hypothetical protein [Pantoea sp. OXWO6B1]
MTGKGYVCRFPLTEHGDAQLLQGCCDYYYGCIDAIKWVMTSVSTVQLGSICLHFVLQNKCEGLAQGIADGVIDMPF